jgi:hypothetical protein
VGGLAEFVGIENSFFVVGAVVTVLMGGLVVHVIRSPELTASNQIRTGDAAKN